MSLATYSRELKVFSGEDGYCLPVIAPIASNNPTRARITWSGDGKWLAVAPLDRGGGGPLPIFKYSNKQLKPMTYVTLPNIISSCFFNWTNRNIAVGNERGEVFVWDIKDKKIAVKVEYSENQPLDTVTVSSDDSYIASGSFASNKICLHGLKTNKVVNTLKIPKSKETSSLKFCLCKKNYLGASSIESTVCIWDIAKSDYIFKKYDAHKGACTDISFSPINYDILASVCLTKTLKIHDVREGKTVLEATIQEPINCVDIIHNGDKVALGTTGGSVIIYDLRADKVLQTIKVHQGPVLALKTQNLKMSKSYTEIEINTPEVIDVHSKTVDISVMDLFSPISHNNAKDISNCLLSQSKMLPTHSTPNLLTHTDLPTSYDDSFFKKVLSPLQKSKTPSTSHHLSQVFYPVKEKSVTPEKDNKCLDVKIEIKKELSSFYQENGTYNDHVDAHGGSGDGPCPITNEGNQNCCSSQLLSEIREIRMSQKAILDEISSVKEEIKILKEDHNALKIALNDDIKQEIQTANMGSIINHNSQKLLINDLNEAMDAFELKVKEDIRLNTYRLMYIYEAIQQLKKS